MTRSMKAALLSAFVFPGLGHIYLKRRVRGLLLAGVALAALVLVISNALDTALQLSDAILSGELQPDSTSIAAALAAQPTDTDALLVNGAYAALIITWLLGILDAWRTGRQAGGNNA
jgi:hypothetical protein